MATPTASEATELIDPRAQLAEWANGNDEWVRLLVAARARCPVLPGRASTP